LTGISPFAAKSNEETLRKNKTMEIIFPEEYWKNISSDAKDLVLKMTTRDQFCRISAKECLEHKWLTISKTSTKILEIMKSPLELSSGVYYSLCIINIL
jgi:serine/threonine protein kinase